MEKNEDIIYIVLFGTLLMIVLCVTIVLFVMSHRKKYLLQQNELQRIENEKEQAVLKAIIASQEQERNRIAKNLHDSVGAELSMLKLNFSQYLYFMQGTEQEKNKFKNELNNLDQTIESISAVCKNLYPLTLQNYGMVKTLDDLIKRIHAYSSVSGTFSCHVTDSAFGPDQEKLLNIYRIFQEVLNNILKHSKCSNLDVSIHENSEKLEILFKHNGSIFTNETESLLKKKNTGIGLHSISNRVAVLEGSLDYFFQNERSQVVIKIPMYYEG